MIVFLSRVSVYAASLQHAQSQWLKRNWLTRICPFRQVLHRHELPALKPLLAVYDLTVL